MSKQNEIIKHMQEEPELDAAEELDEELTPADEGEELPELSELELMQQRCDELNDRHLRLMAEYDNFRKRTQREKEDLYASSAATVVEKFLPVWDNFERAAAFDCNSEDFAKGFELIRTSFQDVLGSLNVEAFGEAGEPFDPNRHYAVSHIEDEALGENVISQVMQKGYRLGERIVRYAMVQTAN